MLFNLIEHDDRKRCILIGFVHCFGRVIQRILRTDHRANFTRQIDSGFGSQAKERGIPVQPFFSKPV